MHNNNDFVREDIKNDDLRQAFHIWKHENVITKMITKYLKDISDRLVTTIVVNANSPAPIDQKLHTYYSCAAKLELITEILSLTLEDFE